MYTLLSDLMMIKVMNINSIFKRKHKYLVTFYKPSRVRKYICTRTIGSTLQFALKKSFKYGVFTIKRLDRQNMTRITYVVYTREYLTIN